MSGGVTTDPHHATPLALDHARVVYGLLQARVCRLQVSRIQGVEEDHPGASRNNGELGVSGEAVCTADGRIACTPFGGVR